MAYNREEILSMMRRRILILDGATGTYLQHLKLTEEDFRGSHPTLANHPQPLKGCNDILCVTRPEIIRQMHRDYILAGADIIETNSFNCNCFSLADYGLEDKVYEISKAAATCAKEAAMDALEEAQREGKAVTEGVIVAGSMGPSNRTLSISPDVNDPAKRDITFDQLADTYYDQARGLMDGGADVLLVETIFDTLNAKAALYAIDRLASERGIDIPVMASGTLSDASGRTLSGQTVEAYYASLKHAHLLSIGLNCGFGAKQLLPWLKRLAAVADCAISVHPNAGLPNVMGEYDETPELFALHAEDFMKPDVEAPIARFVRPDSGCAYINIIGGCCGTTPDHIRAAAEVARRHQPRPLINSNDTDNDTISSPTLLSGLEMLRIETSITRNIEYSNPRNIDNSITRNIEPSFINIGERTNVAGSAKFKRLIKEGNYEEAISVARAQVNAGAQVIDICMDDGMIDGIKAMTTFLNLIASEPDIARVPVMIDSSKWEILKAGLQCVQGKSVVNSISLKEGEERFLDKARHVKAMGAAMVVMLFDENGQADTYERKVSVARRAYAMLKGIGFPTEDVIFDPNVLAVATGMEEHNDYGRAFIEACRTIKEEMPEVHLSGGISNLSFSFRGNNTVRKAMHSVILHHARAVGLDMSIVNPAMTTRYEDIAPELKECVEDVILNKNSEAADRLLTLAQKIKEEEDAAKAAQEANGATNGATTNATTNGATTNGKAPAPVLCEASGKPRSPRSLKERITAAFLTGNADTIEEDSLAAYNETANALAVIEEYLMPAMEQVGKLFGEGKMFLPQVVKSARVMKKAVGKIEPFMGAQANKSNPSPPSGGAGGGAFLIATVKGDVHDIGKNIVSVVTQCNGYRVKDLGVMVDAETIVTTAQEWGADVIGLSGLITPSLDEMINVVRLLESRGMTTPVIVGGATTSALHTAVKMAPEYPHGVVIHAHAAADNPTIIRHLTGTDREEYIAEHKNNQRLLRDNYLNGSEAPTLLSLTEARKRRWQKPQELVAKTDCNDIIHHELSIETLLPLINWNMFHQAWGLKGDVRHGKEGEELKKDALAMLHEMHSEGTIKVMARTQILPAVSNDDDEIVVGGVWHFAFPRSLKDEPVTNCLGDHITREGGDSIAPFCVTAGIGLKALQERYRKDDDEYRAIMAKLLCDRLAQAACDWLQLYLKDTIRWGNDNISMAFGYGACPDHSLKRHVFDILDIENTMGLHLTDSNMITPEESICGLIMANTPKKYFNI